jgi:hypothetical protein
MSTQDILDEVQESQGWTDATLLGLLIQYLDNQASPDSLRDFLGVACASEDEEGPFTDAFLSEDDGATLYCNHCSEQVRSNEAHTCPSEEEEKTPWALFNEMDSPEIQRIDEESEEGQTDDTAAISFVRDLEQGTPEALAAAEAFIKFHGRL